MPELRSLKIKGKIIKTPVIQGGMGVGVSLYALAGAVSNEGGLGVISSACLDRLLTKRLGRKVTSYEAAYLEVCSAKNCGGMVGMNIMFALQRDYSDSVKGALDAGVDFIISGAGLPLSLPAIQLPKDTALIPIVSSARALEIICKKWEKLGYRPDAVVLEGPLAGGHLGFKIHEVEQKEFSLENLFHPVKDMAIKYGDFPVIVAGGIYTHGDIVKWQNRGADGVQMGTRFLATKESSATPEYKQAVVRASQSDILVAHDPGSPCRLPFRVIKQSPAYLEALGKERSPKCDKGYVLMKDTEGNFSICPAKESNEHDFCICNALLSSAGYNPDREKPMYTVGSNAFRIKKIHSVKDIMDRLKGLEFDDE